MTKEPKKPDLPPSKFDADLPHGKETFERPYVEELRSENKMWRLKMVEERQRAEQTEAILASLCLQHGVDAKTILHSVNGPIAVALAHFEKVEVL